MSGRVPAHFYWTAFIDVAFAEQSFHCLLTRFLRLKIVTLELTDPLGRGIARQKEVVSQGRTLLRMQHLNVIPPGNYVLRIIYAGNTHTLHVAKS